MECVSMRLVNTYIKKKEKEKKTGKKVLEDLIKLIPVGIVETGT